MGAALTKPEQNERSTKPSHNYSMFYAGEDNSDLGIRSSINWNNGRIPQYNSTPENQDNDGEEASSIQERVLTAIDETFEISQRRSSIKQELFSGVLHWLSTFYVLKVVPEQMKNLGYDIQSQCVTVALVCSMGSILSAYLTNLPFVISAPPAIVIYYVMAMQYGYMMHNEGNSALIITGFLSIVLGIWSSLFFFLTSLIPDCIQASTAAAVGFLTSVTGLISIKLIVPDEGALLLKMGAITPEIIIAMTAVAATAIAMTYKIQSYFVVGICTGTILSWWYYSTWPPYSSLIQAVDIDYWYREDKPFVCNTRVITMAFSLVFLYTIIGNGISKSLTSLAALPASDGSDPKRNWLFIVCGFATIVSGCLGGPPVLVAPQSAPGIQAGAKTGLSALTCGVLYSLSSLFSGIFTRIPPSGTCAVVVFIGLFLCANSFARIHWKEPKEGIPALFILVLVPFTHSVVCGVTFGYLFYILMAVASGDVWEHVKVHFTTQEESCTDSFEDLKFWKYNYDCNCKDFSWTDWTTYFCLKQRVSEMEPTRASLSHTGLFEKIDEKEVKVEYEDDDETHNHEKQKASQVKFRNNRRAASYAATNRRTSYEAIKDYITLESEESHIAPITMY